MCHSDTGSSVSRAWPAGPLPPAGGGSRSSMICPPRATQDHSDRAFSYIMRTIIRTAERNGSNSRNENEKTITHGLNTALGGRGGIDAHRYRT